MGPTKSFSFSLLGKYEAVYLVLCLRIHPTMMLHQRQMERPCLRVRVDFQLEFPKWNQDSIKCHLNERNEKWIWYGLVRQHVQYLESPFPGLSFHVYFLWAHKNCLRWNIKSHEIQRQLKTYQSKRIESQFYMLKKLRLNLQNMKKKTSNQIISYFDFNFCLIRSSSKQLKQLK